MIKKIAFLSLAMLAICFQVAFSQANANFTFNGGNTNLCVGECVNLVDNSTSNVNVVAWAWSATGPAPLPVFDDPSSQTLGNPSGQLCFYGEGTYLIELQITDQNGIIDLDQVQVNVSACPGSLNAGFIMPTAVCVGDCVSLIDTSTGVVNEWKWTITNVGTAAYFDEANTPILSSSPNPVICFPNVTTSDPVTVTLEIIGADGKVSKAVQQVIVAEIPTVSASGDTIVELGNPAIISASTMGSSKYRWEPNETVVNPKVLTTFAYPVETTDYIITVEDGNGCAASDTVKIYLNFLPNIGVPSAFSPNGDGKNDLLVVKGLGLSKCIFKIYNRNGIGIYESTEQKNGWDGNYKGREATPGVYYWTLEYQFITGKEGTLSGNTTLVR